MASTGETELTILAEQLIKETLGSVPFTIEPLGKGYNNGVFRVHLLQPIPLPQAVNRQPGTVLIPPETSQLILQITNPDPSLSEAVRIQNTVAAMILMRSALSASFPRRLVPDVYAWKDVDMDNGARGWILKESMPGENLGSKFATMGLERQSQILGEMAKIVKALQGLSLPETITAYGGLRFTSDGNICSGPMTLPVGGPFSSLAGLYKSMASKQLALSERSSALEGWRNSNIRQRLDRFIAEGIDKILSGVFSQQKKVLVHGDLSTLNLLFDPDTLEVTALLDPEFSHVASPLEEYLYSFYDVNGILPGPHTADPGLAAVRRAVLEGFPDPLPPSDPPRQGPVAFGSKASIQWPVLRAWDDALEGAGVLKPSKIDCAADVSTLHWFAQDICPFYFLQPRWIESRTQEQLTTEMEKQESLLDRYLNAYGY